jgi:BolA protein
MTEPEKSSQPVPISAANIEHQLQAQLAPTQLEVLDESAAHAGHMGANDQGFGTHFRVRIASPAFDGKSRVACHRLVYDAMQNFIDQGLHALAIEIVKAP